MNNKQRASLRRALIVVGIVNFVAFVFVALTIGGDALNGTSTGGRYFLHNKGQLTEVSRAVFEYSAWHARSVMLTCVVAIAAGFVLKRKTNDR